ncbi:helix-turn-helix domain-containing protein [Bradyrhizobium sp. CCBAU 45384]|uniref:helix-turn-helix domain-containing protein n=1 Tax=Bradyrhizobium sp. CCBAU 45384 TaxID=858428 RepID=UPI0023069DBC|nr:helix-turn-helix transcriptional regulator [Bradyrhizobium sp. CCBAU 45384]MDA9407937.1 hypothetical protein [Bradyrhizobium sp. CCBAU 45384]
MVTEAKTPRGERLITLREAKGLSRKEAAEQAKIHYNTLHAYEMRDDVNPELKNIRALAKLYDTSVEFILEGVAAPTATNANPSTTTSGQSTAASGQATVTERLTKARHEYIRALAEANAVTDDKVHITVVLNPLSAQIARCA